MMDDEEFSPRVLIVVGQGRVVLSRDKRPPGTAQPARLVPADQLFPSMCCSVHGAEMAEQRDRGDPPTLGVQAWRRSRLSLSRSRAINCERAAKLARSEDGRQLFKKLANQWRELADQIEFLNRLDQATPYARLSGANH